MMYARPIRNLSRCWSFAGLLLFGVATSQPASAANPHDYDIRGMKLGQTVEEIKASMAKLIPGATVHEVFWTEEPGFEKATKVLWVGTDKNEVLKFDRNFTQDEIDYIWSNEEYIQVLFSRLTGRAYLISRSVNNKMEDKKVTFDNFTAKLIEKYGEFTYRNDYGGEIGWQYKDNGERDNKNKCWSGNSIFYDPAIFYSDHFNFSGCGISFAIRVSKSQDKLLVVSYEASLVDHITALNDKKERDARKQEQKRLKEMETVKEHQGNVPKL